MTRHPVEVREAAFGSVVKQTARRWVVEGEGQDRSHGQRNM